MTQTAALDFAPDMASDALASSARRFVVPAELEARRPPEARGVPRDQVRLLVTFREKDGVAHTRFDRLPAFLRAGDLLVVNDSATLPAALAARRPDGQQITLHLSTALPAQLWLVEPRKVEVMAGETLTLPGGARAVLLAPYPRSRRLWIARLDLPLAVAGYLARWGRPIAYDYVEGEWPIDAYQTMFASRPGSAEMPSAGRAFTPEVVRRLERKGVRLAALTLHTGVASLESHEAPYEEWYDVPAATAAAVRETTSAGGRVIAVGTTVVRALESAVDGDGQPVAACGWTDLVITPARGVRLVDGLLTGFHEPEATHLDMLEAIAGRAHLRRAYRAALDGGYLWHEFGDLHLLL
jgi:S-adenosylmethionine:tRNA ribosyltransferase-isomerase